MKIANATIISLINGITAIKDADLPVKTSYIIARDFDALMNAYRPYASEVEKYIDDMEKVVELQQIEIDVPIETIPEEMFNDLIGMDIKISMVSLNALRVFIFTD